MATLNGILDPNGKHLNPLTNLEYTDDYYKHTKYWTTLPVYDKANLIIDKIIDNRIMLFVSETGSGKSVLIPKFALHSLKYKGKVVITNPKQLSTQKNAEWAAKLMDVSIGKEVGYQYRGSSNSKFSSHSSDDTKLLFSTDGSIVAQLIRDPACSEYDIVIVDEAHERAINIDLLLLLLKQSLELNPNLKVIIMSATIDTKLFMKYFKTSGIKLMRLSGKTMFPIETFYLEDVVPIKDVLDVGLKVFTKTIIPQMNDDEKTLFFINSVTEGQYVCTSLENQIKDLKKLRCLSLGSKVSNTVKDLIHNRNTKLIMGTNIAESSITIPNLKYVIDTGYAYIVSYDPIKRMRCIKKTRISKDSAIQRLGRVGRTSSGICYRLYTKEEYESFPLHNLVDILRLNLTDTILRIMSLPNVDIHEIMQNLIQSPSSEQVETALKTLRDLKLVNEDNIITNFGRTIVNIRKTDNIHLSLMMISAYNNKVARECSYICSALQISNGQMNTIIFPYKRYRKQLSRQEYHKMIKTFIDRNSDHLTLLKIITKFLEKSVKYKDDLALLKKWCKEHALSYEKLLKIKKQAKLVYIDTLRICKTENSTSVENILNTNPSTNDKKHLAKQSYDIMNTVKSSIVSLGGGSSTTTNLKSTKKRILQSIYDGYYINQIKRQKRNLYINSNTKSPTLTSLSNESYFDCKTAKVIIYHELYQVEKNSKYNIVSKIY